MSKETKDQKSLVEKKTKKSTSASSVTKKASTKKTTSKKDTSKKVASSKATSSTKKEPKSSKAKKETVKSTKITNKKDSTAKVKKDTKSKEKTKAKKEKVQIVEYYDLPYRYNQTVVKVLAQTPTRLFVYWDISDKDKDDFKKKYGEYFFTDTRPVLVIHNDTFGYSFEVEINDFANSWYLNVADSKCDYRIELGRRPNIKNEWVNKDYFYVTTSNEIQSPNDKILLNNLNNTVHYRNVKNGNEFDKEISSLQNSKNMEKIYNIYDLYRKIYNTEYVEGIYDNANPSS